MKIGIQFQSQGPSATRVESINTTGSAAFRRDLKDFEGDLAQSVKGGLSAAARSLQNDWRSDVSTVLGLRLAKSIRQKVFPERGASLNAAALVWTRAPKIIAAHEQGALIRARRSLWLAIPTPAAGRSGRLFRNMSNGQFSALTPARWEAATGIQLRFVPPAGSRRGALLVMDDAKINKRGHASPNRRRPRKDGTRTGSVTVPIFVLVRQARLPKRLNLEGLARANLDKVPSFISQSWPRS